ncbi:MAG: 6-pyruvoyl-tetrahydropterin synthase-related protein [Calditrichaceae bacterium]
MAKGRKKQKQPPLAKKANKRFKLSDRNQDILFTVLITIFLIFMLKPLVIDGLSPQGVDVIASVGQTHQLTEFAEKTGEKALWNPFIFSGMPTYHRSNPVAFSVDNLLNILSRIFNTVFIYYLFAALGSYLLFRYLKMSPLISLAATLIFILMPHYKSLYLEGHFTKFRALMLLPWVTLTFLHFLDKRNFLSAALFALAFGTQIRTQHYQIVFYTGLMVFAIGIYPFIKDIMEKKYTLFLKSAGLLTAAIVLSITMSAQPLFLAREYLPYSKRGKTTISLNETTKKSNSDGVTLEYATQWSTQPSEILTWIVPRFYGGMSGEQYTGNAVPQLRNRTVPGYWGSMPFTQSYEYMGVLSILLAFLGLFAYRKNRMIVSLSFFALFLVLLSFGRHFQSFYSIFYYDVPFFNKFRAPMMSVTVTMFIMSFLAAFGLKYLSEIDITGDNLKKHKNLLLILGGFFGLGIVMWLAGQMMSFVKPGETYEPQILAMITSIRKEFFTQDLIRYMILLLFGAGLIIGYLKSKISFPVLGILFTILMALDLLNIQERVHKDYMDIDKIERTYFAETATDRFLNNDKEIARILPVGKQFGDNRWAYYHQTIGGYSPIKMYTIEEIIENNLYKGWEPDFPLNWNILKILNVKYVILEGMLSHPELTLVNKDDTNKLFTYIYNSRLPRAFFVESAEVVDDEYTRLQRLNSPDFDPAVTALLEESISTDISMPDSSFSRVTEFNPNHVRLDVFTDKTSLLVISELYYPPGWKVLIDDQPVKQIYKTDHAIQSIIVEKGNHSVDLRFEPDSYHRYVKMASFSVGILYLTILLSLAFQYKSKSGKK